MTTPDAPGGWLRRSPGTLLRVGGLLLCLAAGCQPNDQTLADSQIVESPPAVTDTAPTATGVLCSQNAAPGQWQILPAPDRLARADERALLTLCGRGVALGDLLSGVAALYGIAELDAPAMEAPFLGWVTGYSVEELLRSVLAGYDLNFGYVWDGDVHRLSSIHVLQQNAPVGSTAQPASGWPANDPSQSQRFHADYPELLSALQSQDLSERVDALHSWVAEGEGLDVLDRALTQEPNADVRILMLEKLDESGSVIALQSMLRHLEDPSPDVVVVAIELVADWHDEELVRRHMATLMTHPSEAVQEAAQDAIDRFR